MCRGMNKAERAEWKAGLAFCFAGLSMPALEWQGGALVCWFDPASR